MCNNTFVLFVRINLEIDFNIDAKFSMQQFYFSFYFPVILNVFKSCISFDIVKEKIQHFSYLFWHRISEVIPCILC